MKARPLVLESPPSAPESATRRPEPTKAPEATEVVPERPTADPRAIQPAPDGPSGDPSQGETFEAQLDWGGLLTAIGAEVPEGPTAVGEVLGLRVADLVAMPCHWLLVMRGPDNWPMVVTSAAVWAGQLRTVGLAVFGPHELQALELAAEHDRAGPLEVAGWIARKQGEAERGVPRPWSLSKIEACGFGALPPDGDALPLGLMQAAHLVRGLEADARGLRVQHVLTALGCQLVTVGVGDKRGAKQGAGKVVDL